MSDDVSREDLLSIITLLMARTGLTHAVYTSFELEAARREDLTILAGEKRVVVSLTGS